MENQIDPSWGLLTWQILMFVLAVVVIFFAVKIYKRIVRYLDLKEAYLKKKIDSKE